MDGRDSFESNDEQNEDIVNDDTDSPPEGRRENAQVGKAVPQGDLYSWDRVEKMVKHLAQEIRADKTKKRFEAREWNKALPVLEEKAETEGFSLEFIEDLWEIIAHLQESRNAKMRHTSDKQRVAIIRCMIPNSIMPAALVQRMVQEYTSNLATRYARPNQEIIPSDAGLTRVANAFFEYLIGLHEYSLVENGWVTKTLYAQLFHIILQVEVQVWLCTLLRKIAGKQLLLKVYPQVCLDLLITASVLGRKEAILQLLQIMKLLRPDLVYKNVYSIGFRLAKPRSIAEQLQRRLFSAKTNFSQGSYDNTPLRTRSQNYALQIFPQFRPFSTNFTMRGALSEASAVSDLAVWALMDAERYCLFNLRPDIFEAIDSFFMINFRHKFKLHLYNRQEEEKYLLILRRCADLCFVLGKSLHSLDWWLPRFMEVWDGNIWRVEIYRLFRYLSPFSVNDTSYVRALRLMEDEFLYCSDCVKNLHVWASLQALILRWIDNPELTNGSGEADECSRSDTIHELFSFMKILVSKYVSVRVVKQLGAEMIPYFISFFTQLCERFLKDSIDFKPILPHSLYFSVFMVDYLPAIEALCKYLECSKRWMKSTASTQESDPDHETMKAFRENLIRYITGTGSLLDLFTKEINLLSEEHQEALITKLNSINIKGSSALQPYFRSSEGSQKDTIDINLLKEVAPYLAAHISRAGKLKETRTTEVSSRRGSPLMSNNRIVKNPETPMKSQPLHSSTPRVLRKKK